MANLFDPKEDTTNPEFDAMMEMFAQQKGTGNVFGKGLQGLGESGSFPASPEDVSLDSVLRQPAAVQPDLDFLNNLMSPTQETYPNSPIDPLNPISNIAETLPPPPNIKSLDNANKIRQLTEPSTQETNVPYNLEDTEMADAIKRRNELESFGALMQGAGTIGASIAGVKPPEDLGANIKAMANRQVSDITQGREALSKKLQFASVKEKSDPNSQVSKNAREAYKDMLIKADYSAAANKIGPNITAAQLEDQWGELNLQNLMSAHSAEKARKELKQMEMGRKKDAAKERVDEKDLTLATKLNARVLDLDKKVGYSQAKEAVDLLSTYQYQPTDPAMDIAVLYDFIKLLDPGSAVREGEISLSKEGQSLMELAGLNLKKITRGQVISTKLRNNIISSLGKMAKARTKNFEGQIQGIKNAAKRKKLPLDIVFGGYEELDSEPISDKTDDWQDIK